jgi:hypothetical protein
MARYILRGGVEVKKRLEVSFANTARNADLAGWLTLGSCSVAANPPVLSAKFSLFGFELTVSNAAPGSWIVESTANLIDWSPLLTTNTTTTSWSLTDVFTSGTKFYRVVSQH